jgi:hypothetical protein
MVLDMKALPGIIVFALGIILLLTYFLMPTLLEDINLMQIFFLLPGVILTMAGPVIAYAFYKNP